LKRIDALRAIYPELRETVVVTIMGAVAVELYSLGHQPGFFYLEHAMGLASSMGLGIALSRPDVRVVVLDGDGSILMNLGSLTTMARYSPRNLTHLVFDNEVLLSVGRSFTTATSDEAAGSDLAAIAKAAGIPNTATLRDEEALAAAFSQAVHGAELSTLVAKVEPEGPKSYFMDLHMLENRFSFQRHLQALAENRTDPSQGD
jgi:sulfopyruvate decarboxylase subunit beta